MRILAVTSGRADLSPLTPVVLALQNVGITWTFCPLEGLSPDKCVERTEVQITMFQPNVVLILGDRFEAGCAGMAATHLGCPIAHIHGGEASFGSFDNQIRDAITKLAHIHFVAAEPYRERVISLGEDPDMVFTVGAPGLDNLPKPTRARKKYFVATYHPETLGGGNFNETMVALKAFPDYEVIWTGVNNDPGSAKIRVSLANATVYSDLDVADYHDLVRNAALVIGNSSSGIIEAPSLEVPTVNVGSRQDGRLRGPSVFDCTNDRHDIENCIRVALEYDGPFDNPYGGPGASKKIADILRNVDIRMRKEWPTSLPKSA